MREAPLIEQMAVAYATQIEEQQAEIARLTVALKASDDERIMLNEWRKQETERCAKLCTALDSARKEAKFIADDIDAALANEQEGK